jgi:hypothetical protein
MAIPLSDEAVYQLDALRDVLLRQFGDQETQFHFAFSDSQVLDLASGYVPDSLKAAFRAALDWHEEDKRRARAPARPLKKRKGM